MNTQLEIIRKRWDRTDLHQPVSIGQAFDDLEACLGEITRLQGQVAVLERIIHDERCYGCSQCLEEY